jgi:hypothetical protein
MKRIILALSLASVLYACNKDNNSDLTESPASTEKVPVKFSIEDFLITQQDMTENGRVETDTSITRFKKLSYMAFGSDGSIKSWIDQDSTNTKFGVITDSLVPGTYTIGICAWSLPNVTLSHPDLISARLYNQEGKSTGDVFYKKFQVTVNTNGNSQMDVNLNRIVGYLKLELKDALPTSNPNGEITVQANNVAEAFYFKNDSAVQINNVGWYMNRITQTTWDYYSFGSNAQMWVTIQYKDKITGAALYKQIFCKLAANKKTIISGYLYDVPTSGNFITRANQDWSSDSTVISIN